MSGQRKGERALIEEGLCLSALRGILQASGKLDLKEPFYRQFSSGVPVPAAQPQEVAVTVPAVDMVQDSEQVAPDHSHHSLPCGKCLPIEQRFV